MSSINLVSYPVLGAGPATALSGGSENRFQRTGYAVIASASLLLAVVTAQECKSITHLPSLYYGLVLWVWWGVVAAVLWKSVAAKSGMNLSFPRIGMQLFVAGALALVHLILLGSLAILVPEWRHPVPAIVALTSLLQINRYGLDILIYGFIFGLIGMIQSQFRARSEALSALELQRQLAAAQLKALQMQLEPHFLFNTLNAITTLVELGKQTEAAEMLSHLNAILKTTLERRSPEKVELFRELEIVENYLAIEQVRFADRLRVDIKVDPGALHSLVPCFLLQPIVENAIRHGIAQCEEEGLIEASARREGNRLRISVRNHGAVSHSGARPGNGIGLRNTQERLAYFYPDAYKMQAGPLGTGGFEVAIDVPYERSV